MDDPFVLMVRRPGLMDHPFLLATEAIPLNVSRLDAHPPRESPADDRRTHSTPWLERITNMFKRTIAACFIAMSLGTTAMAQNQSPPPPPDGGGGPGGDRADRGGPGD